MINGMRRRGRMLLGESLISFVFVFMDLGMAGVEIEEESSRVARLLSDRL